MMHHIFDMDSGSKQPSSSSQSQQRKNRMKRMEEISHSLDDGLNDLPDDYGRSNRNRSRQMEPQYDDMDDDDEEFYEPEYIDEYYYNNSKAFDGRPKSYNEKYTNYMYDEYESAGNFHRNRYSLNETTSNKSRYQQPSPVAQQKQSTLRRPQVSSSSGHSGSSGPSSNMQQGSNKHILFNDEEDVHYMSEKNQPKSAPSSLKTKSAKKDIKKENLSSSSSLFSSKKKPSKEDLMKPEKSSSSQQVMKAKLKIQNVTNDDSVLHMRSSSKQNSLQRHHSVEAKLPSHPDRSNMSPTIMEEIEFEMQDVETETEKEIEKEVISTEKVKDKSPKEKPSKEKKSDSAPSTPTTKKSFKAHLSNHKKLFKVPDIDLNRMKFSCFFSSNKNIAAIKGSKKDNVASRSAEALNEMSPNSSPKASPTAKSPPSSPKNFLKNEIKLDKLEKLEKVEEEFEKNVNSRQTNSKTSSGSTILSSSDCFKEDDNSESASEFEVN